MAHPSFAGATGFMTLHMRTPCTPSPPRADHNHHTCRKRRLSGWVRPFTAEHMSAQPFNPATVTAAGVAINAAPVGRRLQSDSLVRRAQATGRAFLLAK